MSRFKEVLLASGLVGKVNALSDIVKAVHREWRFGSDVDFTVPKTVQGVA